MTALRDLENEADITALLQQFYATVVKDEILINYFKDLDMISHLPKISNFWTSLLLGKGMYSGNMMDSHLQVHAKLPLSPQAFERWLALFEVTVDRNYMGNKAEEMKTRAHAIAGVLSLRITGQVLNVGNQG